MDPLLDLRDGAFALLANGPMEYSAFLDALREAGLGDAIALIPALRRSKELKFNIALQSDDTLRHTVSLP